MARHMYGQAEIYNLLHRLGVTANYTGFFHTAYALQLCAEDPDRLRLVTKCLYPDVAKRYGTAWKTVERNIRTVSWVIWRENRPLLEQLARRPLAQKPCTAQLLAILYSGLMSPCLDPPAAVQVLCKPTAFPGEGHDMTLA